jgi:hypothetical protein
MRIPIMLRGVLVALLALIGVSLQSAHADVGGITLVVYKGGWIIGGSAGHGTLNFHGRIYPLGVGGIDYGFLFGGSRTVFMAESVTSRARLLTFTAQPVRALRLAVASARLCLSTRRVPYWNFRADRSG